MTITRLSVVAGFLSTAALLAWSSESTGAQAGPAFTPQVDHHQHLVSPELAKVFSMPAPVTADVLIRQLDAAGIQRALVLSLAFAHGRSDIRAKDETEEYAQVRAENDWVARQAALYPHRLRAVCSVNPLRSYAIAEIDRCARDTNLRRGLKLHFANSQVDLRDPGHVQRLRQVFAAVNAHRMPVLAHVWTGDGKIERPFGRTEAQALLNSVLPAAPDIPVQIAHLGGSGPRLDPGTREGMRALAEAVSKRDPVTRNLYFDIAMNVATRSTQADAEFVAARIREIGVERILYGSDAAMAAAEGWKIILEKLPLTETEIRDIADNVAPYAQW